MHSDNYELSRSSAPQSVKDYSAFTDKQWNTKPDTSGGVYQSQIHSLNLISDHYLKVMLTLIFLICI